MLYFETKEYSDWLNNHCQCYTGDCDYCEGYYDMEFYNNLPLDFVKKYFNVFTSYSEGCRLKLADTRAELNRIGDMVEVEISKWLKRNNNANIS